MLEPVGGVNGGYGPTKLDWLRRMPNGGPDPVTGTGPGGQFRVPPGKFLVIADVDWQYANESVEGTLQVFRLMVVRLNNPDPYNPGDRIFESAVVLGPDRSGGASVSVTSGIVVGPEATLGADVFPGPIGPPGGLQHAILRGYLLSASRGRRPLGA